MRPKAPVPVLTPKLTSKQVPKVKLPLVKDSEYASSSRSTEKTPLVEDQEKPKREPVGVAKPREFVHRNVGKDDYTEQPMTARLVEQRKGTILEIFGSQKSVDIDLQSAGKRGFLSMFQKLVWVKKYFVVKDGFLLYFSKEGADETKPDGVLHLANCDVVDCGTSKRFSFAINCPSGDGLTLLGEAPNDVWQWMTAIYVASKVSTKNCLTAELSREKTEEHCRQLQLLSQQLVRTLQTEVKTLHSQVKILKSESKKSIETLKVDTDDRLNALSSAITQVQPSIVLPSKPQRNAVVDQVIVITIKTLASQVTTLRDELVHIKESSTQDLRRVKEEYESQVFDLATKFAQLDTRRMATFSVRGGETDRFEGSIGEDSSKKTTLARSVTELKELAQLLQPMLKTTSAPARESDLDTSLSAAIRSKLVPVIKDLPTIAELVKHLEEERQFNQKHRLLVDDRISKLQERLELAELDKTTLSVEGQQAYEMLTHIEEQLFTDQTSDGSVFDIQDPTHVKVMKVMKAFERAMTLVAQVELQLLTLTQRSNQDLTTRRDFDE